MKVLVACEFSGVVRDAFIRAGHTATSVDLLPSESSSGPHIMGPLTRHIIDMGWDLMVAHPPCTYVAVSGARWWASRLGEQLAALEFMRDIIESPVARIAMENPIGKFSTWWKRPDQIIQPWMFGHGETKATCLWLKNLPKLHPTYVVDGRSPRIHKMAPGPNRWKERSRTYKGIADAMARQWGVLST